MIQKPKGTADLLPEELKIWHYIEETARIILGDYQFEEMRTPMFESYELFSRGVGDTSDIVTDTNENNGVIKAIDQLIQ